MTTTLDEPMLYPYILTRPGEPPRLARHPRFRVSFIVVDYRDLGLDTADICEQYPGLAPSDVYAALLYYSDHRAEIDREIAEAREDQAKWERESASRAPTKIEAMLRARRPS